MPHLGLLASRGPGQTGKWWFSLSLPPTEGPYSSVLGLSVSGAVELTVNEDQDEDHNQAAHITSPPLV